MKKFLSMVLALAMAMSLVTVSAGAKDFTDDSTITYDKAVDVISALDVVDGYTDGSFQPTTQLTRGAAAKIICNLILGPTTADALSADTAPFKDVPTTNVFAGYITYCSQQGIINGYNDGTFRPSDNLTGYAFMKMLLGALGYDGEIEGFTGPNWSVQVGKLALGIGLADGNDNFVGTKPVTREEACLYAFNTLEATMVEYDSRTSVSVVGGADVVIAGSEAKEMDQGSYKSYTGANSDDDSTLEFCERYFSDLKKDETNDDFGRPADTWRIKSEEIGTYANTEDLVSTFTAKVTKQALYDAISKNVSDDLEDDKSTLTFYKDGVRTVVDADDVSDFVDKNNTAKINDDQDTGNGSLTEVYVDDDNNVTVVLIYTYVFQASSDYSSSNDNVKIAAAGDTSISLDSYTLDGDDFDIEAVNEDDYLLITATKMSNSNKYEVQEVTVAEMVTGEVTEFSSSDDVTIDGTTYKYSATTLDGGVQDEIQTTGGQTALVLDSYGYVIAVDDTVIGGNYVFIADAEKKLGSAVDAYAYFADGTEGTISLKKVGNSTNATTMAGARGWYSYTVDGNDNYTLSAVGGSYASVKEMAATSTGVVIANGKSSLPTVESASGIKANEKTVFVVVDDEGDVGVYTGVSNAPDVTVNSVGSDSYKIGYVYRTSTNYASFVFISVEGIDADVDSSTDDDSFIFLTKLDSTKTDANDTYYVYKAIVDGVETTVETDSNSYAIMKLYGKVKTDSTTERITGMKEVRATDPSDGGDYTIDGTYVYDGALSNVTVNYSNGVLTFGSYDFVVNSDTQLNLVLDYSQGTSNKDTDVRAMMADSGAKYEANANIGGSSLKSTLSGYTVSGKFYAVTEDDYLSGAGNQTLDYLVLYVDAAVDTGVTSAATPVVSVSGAGSYTVGDTVTLTASVSNSSDCGTLTYQWYKDDAAISGATAATYSFTAASGNAGTYKCVVTNTDTDKDNTTATGDATAAVTVGDVEYYSGVEQDAVNADELNLKSNASVSGGKLSLPVVDGEPLDPQIKTAMQALGYTGVSLSLSGTEYTITATNPYGTVETIKCDTSERTSWYTVTLDGDVAAYISSSTSANVTMPEKGENAGTGLKVTGGATEYAAYGSSYNVGSGSSAVSLTTEAGYVSVTMPATKSDVAGLTYTVDKAEDVIAVKVNDNFTLKVTVGGTSSAATPVVFTVNGGTMTDGTVEEGGSGTTTGLTSVKVSDGNKLTFTPAGSGEVSSAVYEVTVTVAESDVTFS